MAITHSSTGLWEKGTLTIPKNPPEARLPDWESLVAVVDGLFHVADVVPFAVIA